MPPRNKGFSLRLSFSVQLCKQKPAIALQNWTDLPYRRPDAVQIGTTPRFVDLPCLDKRYAWRRRYNHQRRTTICMTPARVRANPAPLVESPLGTVAEFWGYS